MSATNIRARRALSSQTFTQGGRLSDAYGTAVRLPVQTPWDAVFGLWRPCAWRPTAGIRGYSGWQPRLAARTDSQVCGPAAYIDNPSWQLILKTQDGSPADSPWSATVAFSDRRSDKTPVGEKPAVQKRSTRQIGARERSGFGHASPQNPVGEKSSVQKNGRESDVCDVAHQRTACSAYGTGRPRATIPPARWARRPRDARLGCAS